MPDVGVMVEIPAAVYQAKAIIKRVDFLSVGSNDLTQYMLAVDRNNAQVAGLYQHFHPAVLHALRQVVEATRAARKPISICGEMAGNPGAAILLLAMGYDQLSMSATSLPIIKCAIRSVSMAEARKMLATVLKMDNAWLIKKYMDEQLGRIGLSQLLRKN
jgi:phosphotransferase system enzyme I (PtsP)